MEGFWNLMVERSLNCLKVYGGNLFGFDEVLVCF